MALQHVNVKTLSLAISTVILCACQPASEVDKPVAAQQAETQAQSSAETQTTASDPATTSEMAAGYSEPLVTHIYTADPSAHVFNDRLYIYPSHDVESGIPQNDNGDHFDMRDYHILSMDEVGGEVTDHGVALSVDDIPWAGRQLWAPDAAEKDGTYYKEKWPVGGNRAVVEASDEGGPPSPDILKKTLT